MGLTNPTFFNQPSALRFFPNPGPTIAWRTTEANGPLAYRVILLDFVWYPKTAADLLRKTHLFGLVQAGKTIDPYPNQQSPAIDL
jgi:hypothetical protein